MLGLYDGYLAELALWERRWTDADAAVRKGLARARPRQAAQIRVRLCAKGLRAQAELAALARARRDADAVRNWLGRARKLVAVARRAAAEASAITPNAGGWLALAEAEYGVPTARPARVVVGGRSHLGAARTPAPRGLLPLARGRGARRGRRVPPRGGRAAQGGVRRRGPDRGEAPAPGARTARPTRAARSRAAGRGSPERRAGLEETLGLTPREAEVLTLVARGYTNREIAATLVISVKTASVHVSHILRKLGAPNRLEAATIAHRVAPRRMSSDLSSRPERSDRSEADGQDDVADLLLRIHYRRVDDGSHRTVISQRPACTIEPPTSVEPGGRKPCRKRVAA